MTDGQPTTLPPSRWGVTYRGVGDLETATLAVEAAVADLGMSYRRKSLQEGAVEIEALQEAGWFQVLTRGLAQRAIWRIESRDGQLLVSADFHPFRWFLGALLGFCGLIVFLLLGSSWVYEQPWVWQKAWVRFALTAAVLTGLFLMGWFPVLLGALGGGRMGSATWRGVLARVEAAGGYLEPVDSGISRRFRRAFIVFAVFSVALTARIVWLGLSDLAQGSPAGLAVIFCMGCLSILFIGAFFVFRRSGASLRATPVVTGLISSITVLTLLLPVILLSVIKVNIHQLWEFRDEAAAVVAGSAPPGRSSPAEIETLQRVYRLSFERLRFWGWSALTGIGMMLLLGALFALYGVRLAVHGWVSLERLSRLRERGAYKQAVQGGAVLWVVRSVFFAFWTIYSGLILTALTAAVLSAFQAVFPSVSWSVLHSVELSATMLAFSLPPSVSSSLVSVVTRIGWFVYGVGLASLFALSVGQLWRSRRATRRSLEAAAPGDSPEHRRLRELTASVCTKTGLAPVGLAVTSERAIEACSHAFGLFRAERFLEISEGALRHLNDEELGALLAHELAHHLCGHLGTYNRLRWLGRLTFVGDGFVRALLDTFGSEAEADRAAVEELEVSPAALLHCLMKVRQVNPAIRLRELSRSEGSSFSSGRISTGSVKFDGALHRVLAGQLQGLSTAKRWRLAWLLFLGQYFFPTPLHYWHPGHGDRRAALRAMMEKKTHG